MNKFLLILLTLFSSAAFAAISKWVDANGEVHYSDKPPPGVNAETLRSASSPENTTDSKKTNTPTKRKTLAEQEAELKKAQQAKQAEAEKMTKKQAEEDARKANCEIAQQNLRALQSGIRMMELNAQGERSYLDDNQRQQRIAKAQQDVSNLCK